MSDLHEQFSSLKSSKDVAEFQSLCRQLNKLETKANNLFEKLNDKLECNIDATESDIIDFEEWSSTYSVKLESLSEEVNRSLDRLKGGGLSKGSDFSTYFKKQDPPRFKGDCLEYLEWKKRWESQVSSHKPPADFEIDLLKRNLPEEGRKKLYGCDSLSTAWRLLDKMYGDKPLIIQKLKSKLRNLKPKSKEPHEIVIEI